MITLPFQIRLSEVSATPWKNGGGVTRELLAWPSVSDWAIRVSVADIEHEGPFSAFPGVERYFAVLEGEGVELEGVGAVRVGDSPVKFEGDSARKCRLLNGPTRDLNVMIRRERGRGFLLDHAMSGDSVNSSNPQLFGTVTWPEGLLVCNEGDHSLMSTRSLNSHSETRVFQFAFWSHKPEQL